MFGSNANEAAALSYAARGWHVFPCHYMTADSCSCGSECKSPGKHPMTPDGFKSATTDPDKIRAWWQRWPQANVAIRTGEESGLWVLDLDGEEGVEAFVGLAAKEDPMPKTPCVKTGGGGRHLYFKWSPAVEIKNRAKVASLSIDVRGTGGYVLAPPSNHKSGNLYEWEDSSAETTLAEAPEWVIAFVQSKSPAAPALDPNEALFAQMTAAADLRTAPGVAEGSRHTRACELIGAHLGRGENPIVVLDLAFEWGKRCTPPMDQAEIARIGSDLARKDAEKLESEATLIEEAPWPVLAPPALYGLAGEIVRAIEPHTEADSVAILVTLLVFYGSVIGRSAHFIVEATRHFGNLFAVLVGETAKGRKGTSVDRIRDLFRGIDDDWLTRRVKNGLSSGEGLIWEVRDPIEKEEPIKEGGKVVGCQKVITDHGIKDKRLLIVESEFASVLRIAKREGNTLSQVIRDAWDSGFLRTMTKNSPAHASAALIAMLGHITQEELLRSLAEVDAFSGFANRFLWICVKRSKLLPEGGGSPNLTPLIDRLGEAVRFAMSVERMTRDAPATVLWAEQYKQLARRRFGGTLGAVTNRAEAQALRLSMLYALLDMKPIIESAHLEAAMALWQYAEDSARWTFGTSTGDPLADRLLTIIREKPVRTKEIHDATHRHFSAARIQQALYNLGRMNLIRREQNKTTGGRPATIWSLAEE